MILFVAAMASEVRLILNHLTPDNELLVTGVGKVNAASKLSTYLATHHVDSIVNLGFAGATEPYAVGDVVMINRATYHDFDLSMFGYQKGQVPGMPVQFQSDPMLLKQLQASIQHVKIGDLLTGDVFMTEKRTGQYLVDMEGAALFHVAYMHQIPMVSIKVVSDIMGSDAHLEHYQSFEMDAGALALLHVYQSILKG